MSERYTVIWKRSLIETQIAALVAEFMERGEDISPITAAMAEIDRLLKENPESCGESRPDFERLLIVPPLTVTFEVHEEERIVYVLRARYARPRSQGSSE